MCRTTLVDDPDPALRWNRGRGEDVRPIYKDPAELADGEGETLSFSVGRSGYVIDLTDEEVGAFYDVLKPYVDAARKDDGSGKQRVATARSSASKKDLTAIREWASKNGFEVSSRGRIAGNVVAAYEAAN